MFMCVFFSCISVVCCVVSGLWFSSVVRMVLWCGSESVCVFVCWLFSLIDLCRVRFSMLLM